MRRGSRSEIHHPADICIIGLYLRKWHAQKALLEQHKEAASAPLCVSLSDLPVEQTKRQEEQ